MFVGHVIGVVHQFIQIALPNLFITDIDLSFKPRKVDIDPIRVLRLLIKKQGILNDLAVYRVFKGVRIAGLIKGLIGLLREVDLQGRTC